MCVFWATKIAVTAPVIFCSIWKVAAFKRYNRITDRNLSGHDTQRTRTSSPTIAQKNLITSFLSNNLYFHTYLGKFWNMLLYRKWTLSILAYCLNNTGHQLFKPSYKRVIILKKQSLINCTLHCSSLRFERAYLLLVRAELELSQFLSIV